MATMDTTEARESLSRAKIELRRAYRLAEIECPFALAKLKQLVDECELLQTRIAIATVKDAA